MGFGQIYGPLLLGLITFTTVKANCAHGTTLFPRSGLSVRSVMPNNFTYDALTGPLNWYGLDKVKNAACAKGLNQSPQVIDPSFQTIPGNKLHLDFEDYPSGAEFENLGTTIEAIVNGTLKYGGTLYNLRQYHFHLPSEHRVLNEFYPGEMHMVFQSATGEIAVIGVLIDLCNTAGCTDPLLEATFENLEDVTHPGDVSETGKLSFSALKKNLRHHDFWKYKGSLTTPPCAEQVTWLLSQSFVFIDLPTWNAVKKVVKFNSRYTQDTLGHVNLEQNIADELNDN